jgi:predicted RNA-binding protein with RPS1 domain
VDHSQVENSQLDTTSTSDQAASVPDASATSNDAAEASVVAQATTEPQAADEQSSDAAEAAPAQPNATPADAQPQAAPAQAPASEGRQPSMAQIMESDEFSSFLAGAESLDRGALIKGIVVRRDENTGEVLVDVGTKSEGIISKNEMGDDEIAVGSEIEVVVLRPEDDDGHPVLSKRRADFERRWRELAAVRDANEVIEGTVREQVKGGLIVDLGVSAFVPASHVDARNRGDLSRFVGRTIPVRVIEIDRKKNKVIASHRMAAEEDRKKREEEAWGTLEKDKIVEGIVRRITDFGAFVDLGGVDGLLHVREMAWNRVEHPENVVKKGQKLQVLILEIDDERKRVALGLKQLQPDPWKKAAKDFRVGQMITGKISRIAPTCAFMDLADGIEGIIPISEMSDVRINKPEDVLEVGQEIEARVKQLQPNQRRITLSLRAATVERERRETRTAVREVNERASSDDSGGGTKLGDLFGQELRAARERGREREATRKSARERAEMAAQEEDWDGTIEEIDNDAVVDEVDGDVVDVEAAAVVDSDVVDSPDAEQNQA